MWQNECILSRVFLALKMKNFIEQLGTYIIALLSQVKRDDQQSMKYVELLLVADYAEVRKECSPYQFRIASNTTSKHFRFKLFVL